ncbi:MAG: hypothetical protein HRU24_03525 [Gammaproteobacteria bacterium]|nr:hypothetical protein [Gammaproteobacteria bacterium]
MFKQTIEALLTGMVICETADNDLFQYLEADSNKERVSDFLSNLDRQLSYLDSAQAYYCTYNSVDSSNKSDISSLFGEVRSYFRPLVEWLDIHLVATGSDTPLRAKDIVNINELFEAFEHDQTLTEQLRRLTTMRPFKTSKIEPREQLVTIFSKLEELGYFVRKSAGSSRYYATARFDLIYLLIEFLNDSEKLQLPEEHQSSQEELLL